MFTDTEEFRTRAFGFFLEQHYLGALEESMKAITISPSSSWTYYLMGLCYFRLGQFTNAYAYLQHFLNLRTPKSQEATSRAKLVVKEILKRSNIKEGEYKNRHVQFPERPIPE